MARDIRERLMHRLQTSNPKIMKEVMRDLVTNVGC